MKKIIYWLRKIGMIRTSSYKVKGDARKLNEITASDGGMIQSQKEIDEKYHYDESKKNTNDNGKIKVNIEESSNNNRDKNGDNKILFWTFLVFGVILFLLMLLVDVVAFAFIFIILWGWFLRGIWQKSNQGSLLFAKTLTIGIVSLVTAVVVALIVMPEDYKNNDGVVNDSSQEVLQKNNSDNKKDVSQSQTKQKNKNKEENKKEVSFGSDNVSQFFKELGESLEISYTSFVDDNNLVWTNGGAGLRLNGAKKVTVENLSDKQWQSLQKYFEEKGGTTGTIGMKFVGDKNQMGYYFTKKGTDYYMLMCVATKQKATTTISCGWGPGGGK